MVLVVNFGKEINPMIKKNKYNSEKIYSIKPHTTSSSFIYLLHLLTDENIMLTFEERDKLYKLIYTLIDFLEDKKNYGSNN